MNQVSSLKYRISLITLLCPAIPQPEWKGKIINMDFVFCVYGMCLSLLILVPTLVVQQSRGSFLCV